jgi:hypothetical protein
MVFAPGIVREEHSIAKDDNEGAVERAERGESIEVND